MRLEKFEQSDHALLGEGEDKETYINPSDGEKIISVLKEKEGVEKESPNKLKGAFYLTKIAHLLIPDHVPDIYQAGESSDGEQTFDRKLIRNSVTDEDDSEMTDVTMKLSEIGLGFNIDENQGNYNKDEKGKVNYLEVFMPWEVDVIDQSKLDMLFDEGSLRKAIEQEPDPATKILCEGYLDRLVSLCEEESVKQKERVEAVRPVDHLPEVKEIEDLFAAFEAKYDIGMLNAIKTEEEAMQSTERKSAKEGLRPILDKINGFEDDKSESFRERYKVLTRAVGMINGQGLVDHNRG
jgi:hypothetical protein